MTRTERGSPADVSSQLPERGFEPSDVRPRGVVYAVFGIFAALFLSGFLLLVMYAIFDNVEERPAISPLQTAEVAFPMPRLEADPPRNRADIEANAAARLDGYGWTDREAGLAHIPIEAAMRLLASRGWPDPAREAGP